MRAAGSRGVFAVRRGALYADVVEEHAGRDGGLGDSAEGVGDVEVVAGGDDIGAEAAVVEFVEDCAANELAGAVGVDEVEQAREELATEGLYGVDIAALLFCHGEEAFVEFV